MTIHAFILNNIEDPEVRMYAAVTIANCVTRERQAFIFGQSTGWDKRENEFV
jgi:hypothetical protein